MIYDYDLKDLENTIESLGEKKYRAKQIFLSLYKDRVTSYDEMTTLKKEFRDILKEKLEFPKLELVNRQVSSDTTEKFLFRLNDSEKTSRFFSFLKLWISLLRFILWKRYLSWLRFETFILLLLVFSEELILIKSFNFFWLLLFTLFKLVSNILEGK